ncbi:MAG TPA: OmpA family protein [Steroidobacteraceae bacterium]|jgi:outer membrane protein OmpA-like peptidoglycan-associated protein
MASAAVLQRHLIVRREPPALPFVWRGLLPLLVLACAAGFAFIPFARTSIQGTVEQEVRAQLAAAGYSWVKVAVSGQTVRLTGAAPAAGAGPAAIQLAKVATCVTWLGPRSCATGVTGEFTSEAVLPPQPAAGALAPPHAEIPAAPLTRQGCEHSIAGILAREQIVFASGSAKIDAGSGTLLDQLAHEIRSCPGSILRIEGYTDTVGRGSVNQRLSAARAAAVREALIARGISPKRLTAHGYGARRAIADNNTEAGRAQNRRIEFHAVPAK